MSLRWYTRRDDAAVEKGPFDRLALVDSVLKGELSRDVQVRREDQEVWSTLGQHPAFEAGLAGFRPGASADGQIPGVPRESLLLWVAAVGAVVGNVSVNVSAALSLGKGGAEVLGAAL